MRSYLVHNLISYLGTTGHDLILREYGQMAFPYLEQELVATPLHETLVLDCSGVRVMDSSFVEETVYELALRLLEGRYGERFLQMQEPSAAVRVNLEGTIARLKSHVTIVALTPEPALIGHIEPNLAATFHLVVQQGSLTARMLADTCGLEINTASMRLRRLYAARLLMRQEEVSLEGRLHRYMLPA